jgi:hypothetical protein
VNQWISEQTTDDRSEKGRRDEGMPNVEGKKGQENRSLEGKKVERGEGERAGKK